MKFAMFFMGEYASMLTVCGLNAAIFWGGPLPPLNIVPFTLIPGVIWFILKIMMGIFLYVWLRATLPRLRYDALMNLGWKRMLPMGLVWLFGIAAVQLAMDLEFFEDHTPTADHARPVGAVKPSRTNSNQASAASMPLGVGKIAIIGPRTAAPTVAVTR